MPRFLRALLLLLAFTLAGSAAVAQSIPIVTVSGRLAQGQLRVFTKDTLYQIAGRYTIAGQLIIEPGTTVEFLPNGSLIDTVGGKIIADGLQDAIWNRDTTGLPLGDRFCDLGYLVSTVNISGDPEITSPGPNWTSYVPYLLFYYANRMDLCATDPNRKNQSYQRDVRRAPITFRGRPISRHSPEWGHIVLLPGADSAIFRNCRFVNFRKDTQVVNTTTFYAPSSSAGYSPAQVNAGFKLNRQMQLLTTGGGGAITTFSSKTWLLDCVFDSNFARYHGGAVQFLEAPYDSAVFQYPACGNNPPLYNNGIATQIAPARSFFARGPGLGTDVAYPVGNPEDLYDVYSTTPGDAPGGGGIATPFGVIPGLWVTTPTSVFPAPVQYRQGYDDGRMAVNNGRVRRLTFRDNRVVLSNIASDVQGYRDTTTVAPIKPTALIYDCNPNAPSFANGRLLTEPSLAKNDAYGGAVYVSGRRFMTVYWGGGSAIRFNSALPYYDPTFVDSRDTILCERNYAVNYQDTTSLFVTQLGINIAGNQIYMTFRSGGARGGAFYIGDSTSMVFEHSRFQSNWTATPNVHRNDYVNRSAWSQGGAVYMGPTSPELTMRDNILLRDNYAGQGGAIYVAAVADPFTDAFISPNLLGDSVRVIHNRAEYDGGAIFTRRNPLIAARYLTRIDSTTPGFPLVDHRILFDSNSAGLSGGAITIDHWNRQGVNLSPIQASRSQVRRVLFTNNVAGDSSTLDVNKQVKLYNPVANPITPNNQWGTSTALDSFRFPLSVLAGDRIGGGAIWSMLGNVNLFQAVEFRQNTAVGGNGGAFGSVTPVRANRFFIAETDNALDINGLPIPFDQGMMPEDQRELTRFIRNVAVRDTVTGFNNPNPGALRLTPLDPNRNFTGLGGGIYLNDRQSPVPGPGISRVDSVISHRVRMEQNTAWSGAAVYSDNYELRIVFNKSLIAGNRAVSDTGRKTDTIDNYLTSPEASRVTGAVLYGEIEGPIPSVSYHTDANAIYDNDARYLVRLPDAPQGAVGGGQSGADTLRGNFWGRTEAPVTTVLPSGVLQNTFYVQGAGCTLPLKDTLVDNQQGPFESPHRVGDALNKPSYVYRPIPIYVIPDTLLMEGRIYDIFDKGLDIKAADYKNPRLAPIEDFAVGIPVRLRPFPTGVYAGKVVRRLTRDPQVAETDSIYAQLQREFRGPHPIGYPLFLESNADYTFNRDSANDDQYALNYSVFFVIDVETGDVIRANLRQVREGNPVLRERIEFVADSINRDPVNRRSREDRAGFSIGELYRLSPRYYFETPGLIPNTITTLKDSLAYARRRAAEYEDSVMLAGRRHGGFTGQVAGDPRELGGPGFAYVNRDLNGNPAPVRFADIYSGERYHALPVKQGDRIWVISRTQLWNMEDSLLTVIDEARATGLQFVIDDGDNTVEPPVIFGQRDSLENRTPTQLRNSRFLVEDEVYSSDSTGQDISRIFEVTANDLNGFFDPRSLFFPDRYTALRYEWTPMYEQPGQAPIASRGADSVRLASWLKADTIFPGMQARFPRARRDSTRGFLRFWGTPHNPDVVPGGELLRIRVSNYPPGVQTLDSLKAIADSLRPSADSLARYIFLYPPYFNCQVYDPTTARYLQQDTVNAGSPSTTEYRLRIFVQDTPPRVVSEINPCGRDGLMVANLTNKLRFDYDLTTDDEQEDSAAVGENWDFRFGRTTYGFRFTDRSYLGNGDSTGTIGQDDAQDIRPIWMRDQFLRDTTSPGSQSALDNGALFLRTGIIRVRIDSLYAIDTLLRNNAIANVPFNLDSIYTVVVNDGHMGQRHQDRRVVVNVAPQLLPMPRQSAASLPRAKEDFDYNPQLLDTTRGVRAHDLNVGQRVRYTLIYANDALNLAEYKTGGIQQDSVGTKTNTATVAYVRRDRCYAEAGLYEAPKTTPSWLKINPVSGLLYGTPGLNDAPRTTADNGPETVTVVAEDEFGLTDVRTYTLEVDSTNHRPRLYGRPPILCINKGEEYTDEVCVTDRDLGRLRSSERLNLTVISPAGFTVDPSVINGPGEDSVCLDIHSDRVNLTPGKHLVRIAVRDIAGNTDTLAYEITVSDSLIFGMNINARNTRRLPDGTLDTTYAFQDLFFGLAAVATTGEEASGIGRLDSLLCEYELPPIAPLDVFDARWTIVTTQGTLRNIFPLTPSPDQGTKVAWKGVFQAGDQASGSPNYPVVFTWSKADAYTCPHDIYFEDQFFDDVNGTGLLRVNMKTGAFQAGSGIQVQTYGTAPNDSIRVTINNTTMAGFKIIYDQLSEVKSVIAAGGYTLSSNVPNPVTSTTEISYYAPARGDVALEIYNSAGILVRTLVKGEVESGAHTATWDATDDKGQALPSGAYTYRLRAGSATLTKSMVLVK